jgi:hypothetical protein
MFIDSVSCPTNRRTGAAVSASRIKRDPSEVLGSGAVFRQKRPATIDSIAIDADAAVTPEIAMETATPS